VPTANTAFDQIAQRLLRSTAARSYDPELEIDWSAPLREDAWCFLEQRCSLYGTAIWDELTPAQRLELSKHEVASVAGTGIWLELILMRMLTRLAYSGDVTSGRIQYALAEVAEECRHTIMFARMIETLGTPAYHPGPAIRALGRFFSASANGPAMWAAILLGEEITDRFQREMADDDSIQPLVRMVNRIHIVEEARHIGFAREELRRAVDRTPAALLPAHKYLIARLAYIIARNLVSPDVYKAIGLDPRAARRAALANPLHHETIRFGGEKITTFLAEQGLVGGPGMLWWRRSFLL
jgi:P-aminobenzoate N-oxygenase AurF